MVALSRCSVPATGGDLGRAISCSKTKKGTDFSGRFGHSDPGRQKAGALLLHRRLPSFIAGMGMGWFPAST